MTVMTLVAGLLLPPSLSAQPPAANGQRQQVELESLGLACQANREAFRFGTFRFDFITGRASSTEEGAAGKYSADYTGSGFYAFDGKNCRFECLYTLEDLVKSRRKITENEYKSLSPVRILCDGDSTLADYPLLDEPGTAFSHSAMIHAGTRYFTGRFNFPLWLGQDDLSPTNLSRVAGLVKDGKCTLKELDFRSHLDGAEVCKVVLDFGTGGRTYWIDTSRGAIPVRIEFTRDSKLTHLEVLGDIRFVAGAGWLPMSDIFVMLDGKSIKQTRITAVEVAQKPGPSVFQLDFPSEIGLYDEAKKLKYAPRKTWSLLHLPARGSRDAEPAEAARFEPPPVMAEPIESSGVWPTAFFVLAVVLVGMVALRVLIRRQASRLRT
jgi:hypothetical protein